MPSRSRGVFKTIKRALTQTHEEFKETKEPFVHIEPVPPPKDYYAEIAAGFQTADLNDPSKNRTIMPARCLLYQDSEQGYRIDLPGLNYDMFLPQESLKAIPESAGFDEAFRKSHCIVELSPDTKFLKADMPERTKYTDMHASVLTDAMTRETTLDILGPQKNFEHFTVKPTGCKDGLDSIMRAKETGVSPYTEWKASVDKIARQIMQKQTAGRDMADLETAAKELSQGSEPSMEMDNI